MTKCVVADCEREAAAARKGMCYPHYKREHYAKNKERLAAVSRERMAIFRREHPEVIAERSAKYRQRRNHEVQRLKKAKYYQANRERFAEYRRRTRWMENTRRKRQYQIDPLPVKARNAARRARKRGAVGNYTPAQIRDLHAKQKGCCACCRVKLTSVYHRDHVVPIAAGGANDITNIQLLCVSCNSSKQDKHPIDFMRSRGFLL